jgi:two-component system phosphate regulon sensor histidine kinase PhoR
VWPFLALTALAALVGVFYYWRRQSRGQQARIAELDQRLRDANERFRRELEQEHAGQEVIFDCMIEGLVVLDSEGRIRLINQAVENLFQLNAEARGRTLLEAFRRHELQDLANRASAQGQALGLELTLDGPSRRCLAINATAFHDTGGTQRGVILVFHDVTRLNELEATRREFVANVSHELRTPITIIKGYVETLLDGARNDPQLSLKFLQTIEKHTNRLTFLIEDLLTISQLEEGRIVVNHQWGQLHTLVAKVLEDFASRAAARNIALANQVPESLTLRADLDRLQQVLVNLIDNAIKYGRAGGHVSVAARILATQDSPDRIEISVTDDGPGIPKESIDRIFERFYRVDTARSREQGGTGLGLSIVKHIVQAHGGDVSAESQPGKGTTFRLTLPGETPSPPVR